MKFGAHIIAIMAVAFLIVPTLCADDTPTPADTSRKEESANSPADPGVQAQPAGKTSLLFRRCLRGKRLLGEVWESLREGMGAGRATRLLSLNSSWATPIGGPCPKAFITAWSP
jgi:hypothetical protein